MNIKFAHLADLHLGSFREKRLTELNFKAFQRAIQKIIEEEVDYCLFAGDIFNHAMPQIELVTSVVSEFKKLKNNNIRIYIIGGSHDYSNSGKSFLDLLEEAGVFVNVCKYELVGKDKYKLIKTIDEKTNSCFYGLLGKKKELEKNIYKNLEKIELDKSKFNVFMFHSTLDDLKPDFMKNVKVEINSSFLPKGFNYYAGGHVHTFIKANYDNGVICYPGALFPNNFFELKTEEPSFNICEFENGDLKLKRVKLNIYQKEHIKIDFEKINPIDAKNKILGVFENIDVRDKLILLELKGIIEGKISDVGLNEIISHIYNKDALIVLKSTSKLTSSLIDNYESEILEDIKQLEDKIIESYLSDSKDYKRDFKLIKDLLQLDLSKQDEERNIDYEERVIDSIEKSLKYN